MSLHQYTSGHQSLGISLPSTETTGEVLAHQNHPLPVPSSGQDPVRCRWGSAHCAGSKFWPAACLGVAAFVWDCGFLQDLKAQMSTI